MKKKGFTLIEAVIAIVITAIIALAIATYIREGIEAWRFLSGQKSLALTSRAAMNRVVKELRRVRRSTNITTWTSQEMTFLDVETQTVTFSQEGTSLLRNGEILLDNLEDPGGLQFSYLDSDGSPAEDSSDIALVRCKLTVVKNDNRFILESAARIRVKRIK